MGRRPPANWPEQPVAHPLVAALIVGIALTVLFTNILVLGFEHLGVPGPLVLVLLGGSLLGSTVNIPLWRRAALTEPLQVCRVGLLVSYQRPEVAEQIIAVNLGGALIPLGLSLWLLPHAALWKIGLAAAIVVAVTHRAARVEPGAGIAMPALLPPIVAGVSAWLIAAGGGREAAPIAYVSGTLGTLIGADLLILRRLQAVGPGVMSIGGAGVFDGVFLAGLVAAVLA